MLGLSHEESVIEAMWLAADACTKLPPPTARYFFELKGPMPSHYDNRRSFHRYYLRGKAILVQGDRVYGVDELGRGDGVRPIGEHVPRGGPPMLVHAGDAHADLVLEASDDAVVLPAGHRQHLIRRGIVHRVVAGESARQGYRR